MDKVIPILPCNNIQAQAEFYQNIGFELVQIFTRPNPYAVLRYGEIEIHFFGNKKFNPSENPSMCVLQISDVDNVCEKFTDGLKKAYGKIPRSGIPKITKVRDLANDRRFTLTDTGGNTIYVLTPNTEAVEFRTLENEEYAKDFSILYDLIYSKEDKKVASNMLSKLSHIKNTLSDCDMAKFLLVEIEILGLGTNIESEHKLKSLIEKNKDTNVFWTIVKKKYENII